MTNERFVSYNNAATLWRRASAQMGKMVRVNTRAGWNSTPKYIPPVGQICVCIDRNVVDGVKIPGVKIGDGKAYYADRPFLGDVEMASLASEISNHINNQDVHVSAEDRVRWDNKLNYEMNGETLCLTRL